MLSHHGLMMSEAMAFGLGNGLTFAYMPFIKIGGMPLIAYRMPPKSIIKTLAKRLGITMRMETFKNPETGMRRLDELLEKGEVVGMQTSVFYLSYFPEDMRFHFNAHNLIAFGKEGDAYRLSDPVFENSVLCDAASLKKARFAKGTLAPKGLLYYPVRINREIEWSGLIRKAVRATSNMMLRTPLPIIGVRGIRFMAGRLEKMGATDRGSRMAKLYVGHIIRMQEEIGTGGGGFRLLYAAFLQEAARKVGDVRLQKASEMMTQTGDAWREFALRGAYFCRKKEDVTLRQLADLLRSVADKEKEVFTYLRGIK